ncbi:uncharacterized protein [Lepeophtheirus salmonis]|uniref:Putative LOC101900818 [Musca domestica] n=1 Tax=Lepeophtheirus salmonis TaxID=72036 RepID=A0A0K2SW36_LEPSM|nr:uncharacterized protein LOC121117803 [Lepeophtheirus salmonis]
MMGSHQEANDNEVSTSSGGGGGTNATISGSTASIGVLSLILAIISVAVPHWGSYFLGAQSYNDYSGHFGPFQTCRYYIGGISDCHGQTAFRSSTWIFAAGIVAICTVVAIGVFVLFSILHVAMQLQRKSIWLKDIRTALFIKLVSSSIAVIGCVVAIGLSSWEFEIAKRKNTTYVQYGICYYFQIVLIILNILLVALSFFTYRKGDSELPLAQTSMNPGYPYEVGTRGGSGVSVTNASGSPYPHGHPRMPTHYTNNNGNAHGGGVVGFEPATLSVPQPLRTIQPAPKASSSLPGYYNPSNSLGLNDYRGPGVSFTPGGSTKFAKTSNPPGVGSMESLNSTQSLTLSLGSTVSTGSSHGPLRSILHRPHGRELGSVTSEGSAKHVKLSIGGEQTTV